MTRPGQMAGLPPRQDGTAPRDTQVDAGRIRLCDALSVSLNRSWQVDGPSPEPPVAEFKATAPIAFWAHDGPEAGDIYLAAITAQDAWWLGFESDIAPYAVILDINGRNALTGHEENATLSNDPPNFLVVPDQPWFDAIRDAKGLFHQMIPSFGKPNEPSAGATARLTAFQLTDNSLTPQPNQDLDKVQPLYDSDGPQPADTVHQWPARSLTKAAQPPEPCGRITIVLITPKDFQTLTGEKLDSEAFIDHGDAPAPFDPFQ